MPPPFWHMARFEYFRTRKFNVLQELRVPAAGPVRTRRHPDCRGAGSGSDRHSPVRAAKLRGPLHGMDQARHPLGDGQDSPDAPSGVGALDTPRSRPGTLPRLQGQRHDQARWARRALDAASGERLPAVPRLAREPARIRSLRWSRHRRLGAVSWRAPGTDRSRRRGGRHALAGKNAAERTGRLGDRITLPALHQWTARHRRCAQVLPSTRRLVPARQGRYQA